MNRKLRRIIMSAAGLAMAAAMAVSFAGCSSLFDEPSGDEPGGDIEGDNPESEPDPEPDPDPEPEAEPLTMLKAVGDDLVNKGGSGKVVQLHGVNAGGYMVIERWMTGFSNCSGDDGITCEDHKTISNVLINRFGEEEAEELWENYRSCWWSEQDFQNCADMGINAIRLPFTYMTVDFDAVTDYSNAGDYDLSPLDDFVSMAAEYGIYTILDLHGAYGSQNGKDHSGEIQDTSDVDFYSNETKQTLTVNLWSAVSEHFKDNPYVAGYDILNEPIEGGSGTTTTRHWDFYDKCYDAIRATGDEHVVIFESCWGSDGLPMPSQYGWENCMYSFHHYTGDVYDSSAHNASMLARVEEVEDAGFGVPLYMGEFTCYATEDSWTYTLNLLNEHGWSWTSWTYKLNSTSYGGGWGIYYIDNASECVVNAHTDSIEEMQSKWDNMSASGGHYALYTFDSGDTLYDVFKEYCISDDDTEYAAFENGDYTFSWTENSAFMLSAGWKVGSYKALALKTASSTITLTKTGNRAYSLSTGGMTAGIYTSDGVSYAGLTSASDSSTRFYLIWYNDNIVIYSIYAGAFLTLDSSYCITATAETAADAVQFNVTPE